MAKGSNGQAPQGQGGTEDEDLEDQTLSGDSGDEEEEDEDEGEVESKPKPQGSDLDVMTPEQLKAEALRLRGENARRRTANKTLREQVVASQKASEGKPTVEALLKENGELKGQVVQLRVEGTLRDYVAEKHPQYAKLTKRIAKFVDLEDVDLADSDSIRDAVASAVDDFVKEVPIGKNDDQEERPVTDAQGRPVGSPGGSPSRRPAGDTSGVDRRKKLFPGIYSGTKA